MKTSTKIIIPFAILLLTGTLALFIVTKILSRNAKAGYEWTTRVVQPFSVVVGMGNTTFNIEGCDSDAIAYHLRKGHISNLYVRNDTLYVQQTNIKKRSPEMIVVRSRSLRSIVVSHKDIISVFNLNTGPLSLTCKGGYLGIENWDEKIKRAHSTTTSLDIVAQDTAVIHLSNMRISAWSVNLNNAKLQTNDILSDDLKLNLKNHSWVEATAKPMNVIAIRDSTSHFFIN